MKYTLDNVRLLTANCLAIIVQRCCQIAVRHFTACCHLCLFIVHIDKWAQLAQLHLSLRGTSPQEHFIGFRILKFDHNLLGCIFPLRLGLHVNSTRVTIDLPNVHILCRLEQSRGRRQVFRLTRQRLLAQSLLELYLVTSSEQTTLLLGVSKDSRMRHCILFKDITFIHSVLLTVQIFIVRRSIVCCLGGDHDHVWFD